MGENLSNDKALIKEISGMIESIQPLISQNLSLLTDQVDSIIKSREKSGSKIERLLDALLDYAGMSDEGLVLFKRLCRYYYGINPRITAEYISIYRDLYDLEEERESSVLAYKNRRCEIYNPFPEVRKMAGTG